MKSARTLKATALLVQKQLLVQQFFWISALLNNVAKSRLHHMCRSCPVCRLGPCSGAITHASMPQGSDSLMNSFSRELMLDSDNKYYPTIYGSNLWKKKIKNSSNIRMEELFRKT